MARKNILNRAMTAVQPAVVEPTSDNFLTVKALGWICEDGITYKPGDTWETTVRRSESLGKQIEILS